MEAQDKDRDATMSRADRYQSAYQADYGFESAMVHYRRQLLLERLEQHRPDTVVELGCGDELLYEAWLQHGGHASQWLIVEPATGFAAKARDAGLPRLQVIQDFTENVVQDIRQYFPLGPDMVICSSLLHEIPSADALLRAIWEVMGEKSVLHVNVPNAASIHRRLAMSMGLIEHAKTMSDRNMTFMQHRIYDMPDLRQELASAHFEIIGEGGHMIKPFTHAQMEHIAPIIGEAVLDGLYRLGRDIPEYASEIFLECRKRPASPHAG